MNDNYNIIDEAENEMTGDIAWIIDDICLPLSGIIELVDSFIEKYKHEDFSLQIFDNCEQETAMKINTSTSEMPAIVDFIYHKEKGMPLTFIGTNLTEKTYIVCMSFSKGEFKKGNYFTENGQLKYVVDSLSES